MKPVAALDIRNSAIRLTIGAQGFLLIAACLAFIYQFIVLPQFPEGGVFGFNASAYAACMLPSLLLFAVVLFDQRWSPIVGLVISLIVVMAYTNFAEPISYLKGPGIVLWGFSLACLAAATFVTRNQTKEILKTIAAPFRHPLIQVALIVGVIMACFYGTVFLFFGVVFSGLGDQNPGGFAPNTQFAERRAWGQKEMRQYFEKVDQWVRKSELVTRDIGKVTDVAPIGWPNKVVTFFTDGPSVTMTLQVIGEHGEGVLNLPEVRLAGYVKKDLKLPFGIDEESSWNFLGNSTLITSSGKSWIQEKGLDEVHGRILAEAASENHERVIEACLELEVLSLPYSIGNEESHKWGPELHSEMFLSLPKPDRRTLLLLLGDSHAAIGNKEQGCDCYFDAARISLDSFVYSYWSHGNFKNELDPAVITRELENANDALKKAHQLDPENDTLKKMARERAVLAYQHRNGHLLDSTWNLSDDQLRERTKTDLRDLYIIAVKLAKQSPWLKQELGRMRFRPTKNRGSQIGINKSDRYRARVTVEIAGSTGKSGEFKLNVFEAPELSTPIDLYASEPRYPQRQYQGSSLAWHPDEGKRVRLDSKTLMPRKKKKKKAKK